MPRLLFVVSREHRQVYDELRRAFLDCADVVIVLDRRVDERRRHDVGPPGVERRQGQRRQPPDPQYASIGWRAVRRPDPRSPESDSAQSPSPR